MTFKNTFRQFFCHLQFCLIQITKLNLQCIKNADWTKQTIETEQYMQLQGKFQINKTKLVIKCSLPSLNVNNFFDFKLDSFGSVI